MADTTIHQYEPDYAVHPGEILEETLEARGMKKAAFAKRCGLSDKTVSQIINGKAPVTPETAIQFERVLGVSATVWNNLEAFYRLHNAQVAARKKLERQTPWAEKFPIKELVKRGIFEKPINAVDAVEKLLNFLGVGSMKAWKGQFQEISVAYRHSPSFESASESVATWLRLGELYADGIDTKPYSRAMFRAALKEIRKLTAEPPEVLETRMKEMCAEAGVALVFVSELTGTHLSGATRWLSKDKALIMLSLRHKSDDHLWFSFFHEAAHVLLHGKKEVFLDETDRMSGDKEDEANLFAANMLIPESEYLAFTARRRIFRNDIEAFSSRIGIAPGIVVGRLQHEGKIQHNWHNGLKRRFNLVESDR
jgi:addiction module HigA family antidote